MMVEWMAVMMVDMTAAQLVRRKAELKDRQVVDLLAE